MESIFKDFLSTSSDRARFWAELANTTTPDPTENLIYKSNLSYKKNETFKTKLFILTNLGLYRLSKKNTLSKFSDMRWKVMESFIENSDKNELYGFTIFDNWSSIDFYTENEENLQEWRNSFAMVGILSNSSSDYMKIKKLGKGRFGTVYLVSDLNHFQSFAMKCIKKSSIVTSKNIKLLMNEIMFLRTLEHPSILKLHRVYETRSSIKLILDYCPFDTLHSKIQFGHKKTEKIALKIAKRLLEAVAFLHMYKVMHRDIKLENIFIDSKDDESILKIGDFGLACLFEQTLSMNCGSPGYVAPEILKHNPYNEKIDIFSCGVVIYALFSGFLPFNGNSIKEILEKNYFCQIDFNSKPWNNVSDEIIDLIANLLNRNPTLRPTAERALQHRCFFNISKRSVLNSPKTAPEHFMENTNLRLFSDASHRFHNKSSFL